MFNSILVVCVGNICRSPVAERMLQKLLPEKKVSSAGVGALVGNPVDGLAAKVADEHGIDTSGHYARQLTPEICRTADLILAMSEETRRMGLIEALEQGASDYIIKPVDFDLLRAKCQRLFE